MAAKETIRKYATVRFAFEQNGTAQVQNFASHTDANRFAAKVRKAGGTAQVSLYDAMRVR